jgi:hypothetical protein
MATITIINRIIILPNQQDTSLSDSSIINVKRGIVEEQFFANMVGLSVCRNNDLSRIIYFL